MCGGKDKREPFNCKCSASLMLCILGVLILGQALGRWGALKARRLRLLPGGSVQPTYPTPGSLSVLRFPKAPAPRGPYAALGMKCPAPSLPVLLCPQARMAMPFLVPPLYPDLCHSRYPSHGPHWLGTPPTKLRADGLPCSSLSPSLNMFI